MKYFLSIGAIFKNEAMAMKEWLDHYLREGVEHFYLINNGSTDSFQEILREYDCITLFHDASSGIQVSAYNRYIYPIAKAETEYIGILDLDEFAYGSGTETIASIIKQEPFCTYDRIWCPWLRFGSNGHVQQPPSIVQSFTKRRVLTDNILGKSFAKTSALLKLGIHVHTMVPGSHCVISDGTKNYDIESKHSITEEQQEQCMIRVNHYELQSYDWFHTIKARRGDVHRGISFQKFNTPLTSFHYMDSACIETDTRLLEKIYNA